MTENEFLAFRLYTLFTNVAKTEVTISDSHTSDKGKGNNPLVSKWMGRERNLRGSYSPFVFLKYTVFVLQN